LRTNEVILEKRPDPLDPYRGLGPVAAIMPNIQQQRYATEYQRNLFLNGADPGGVITVPTHLTEEKFDELIERWRESHRGVARAGHVAVLEDGMTYTVPAKSNRDLEYGELRQQNRDELREAWRIHKTMMGTSDDVNRANAQTAQEVFVEWQVIPRLNRRRDTLNNKLLPLFGADQQVEFDYDDPSPENAEAAAAEMLNKAQAAQYLVQAGFDPRDVLETVGLPDMDVAEPVVPPTPPAVPGDDNVVTPPPQKTDGEDQKTDMANYLRRVLSDGYVPIETGRR
jgi:HK97 family phage portal protein